MAFYSSYQIRLKNHTMQRQFSMMGLDSKMGIAECAVEQRAAPVHIRVLQPEIIVDLSLRDCVCQS